MSEALVPLWDWLVDKTGGQIPALATSLVVGALAVKLLLPRLLTLPFKALWLGIKNSPHIVKAAKPSGALVKIGATAAGTYAVASSDFVHSAFKLAQDAPPEQIVMLVGASALAVLALYSTTLNFLGWVAKGASKSFNGGVPSLVGTVVALAGGVAIFQGLKEGHLTFDDPILYPVALVDAALAGFSIWGLSNPKALKNSLALSGPIHLASLCTAGVFLHEIPVRHNWLPESWVNSDHAWIADGSSFALLGTVALAAIVYGLKTAQWNTKRRLERIEEEGTPAELTVLAQTVGIKILRAASVAAEEKRSEERARAEAARIEAQRGQRARAVQPLRDLLREGDDDLLFDESEQDDDDDVHSERESRRNGHRDPLEGMSVVELEKAEREAQRVGGTHPRTGVLARDYQRRAVLMRLAA